jgi:hypothetical protein
MMEISALRLVSVVRVRVLVTISVSDSEKMLELD